MTADGYRPTQSRSGGAISALVLSGAMVTGLALWSPHLPSRIRDPGLTIVPIALPPLAPPPPPRPQPDPRTPVIEHPSAPLTPEVPTIPPTIPLGPATPVDPSNLPGTAPGEGGGPAVASTPTPLPPPVLVQPQMLPGVELQPPYPPEEANAGRGGEATVRVHIDVRGRVTAVEQVSATSAAFFRATQRWAIGHWRFRPATRDGIPEESWRTMRVRFVLND